jgi:hypothetical protein
MTPITMFIAASILVAAVGLVTWAWFAMAQVEEELRFFSGFEGMHLECVPHAAQDSEGARWPTPG